MILRAMPTVACYWQGLPCWTGQRGGVRRRSTPEEDPNGSNGRGDLQYGDTWRKRILWVRPGSYLKRKQLFQKTEILNKCPGLQVGGNIALGQSPMQGYKMIQRQNCGLAQDRATLGQHLQRKRKLRFGTWNIDRTETWQDIG